MVTFLNVDIIDDELKSKFPTKEASQSLSELSTQFTPLQLNIIFVDQRMIRQLNKKFRDKDEETDVLTFLPAFAEVDIDEVEDVELSVAEIYICPKYIIDQLDNRYGEFAESRLLEEVYRMIIHGLLHIGGWEHSSALDYDKMRDDIEPMFVEQEKVLRTFLDDMEYKLKESEEDQ